MVTQCIVRRAIVFEVREVAPRVIEFVGSTEDTDRMGDIIMASGWQLKNFKKNPVFMWAHNYEAPPIGRAEKVWIEDNRLKFHIKFAEREEYEFADTIYRLYKGGYLRATSVGFQPLQSEPIETKDDEMMFHSPTRYLKQDLLELSGCAVPANPNALAEAKSMGVITEAQLIEVENRAAISYEAAHADGTPKAAEDSDWDAAVEVSNAEVDDLKIMCAIVQGDADLKTSYKLPHHMAAGKHAVVWRGVAAAGAVLMGGRGGIDATDAEKNGAKAHLAKHYEEFGRTAPWEEERGMSQAELQDEIDYLSDSLPASLADTTKIAALELGQKLLRLAGNDIPVGIEDGPEKEITEERVAQIVAQVVAASIREAQGKLERR